MDKREKYAQELTAFKPATIWVMLRTAVENPDKIPKGFEWRVSVLRDMLVIAEMDDPILRFEYDPSCYGLTGKKLTDGMRISARGGEYWNVGRDLCQNWYEGLAEKLKIERKIVLSATNTGDSDLQLRILNAQFKNIAKTVDQLLSRVEIMTLTLDRAVKKRVEREKGQNSTIFGVDLAPRA